MQEGKLRTSICCTNVQNVPTHPAFSFAYGKCRVWRGRCERPYTQICLETRNLGCGYLLGSREPETKVHSTGKDATTSYLNLASYFTKLLYGLHWQFDLSRSSLLCPCFRPPVFNIIFLE